MAHELDGKYRITSTTSYQGPLEKRSDGETEIIGGKTERYDAARCKWTSTFEVIDENTVKMTSVADPSESPDDFSLTTPGGMPTRQIVTYEAMLKYAKKGDKIQLSGQISYGNETVFLTMRKIT